MELTVRESNRWCLVERDEKPSAAKVRRQILREENAVGSFSYIVAPAPPRDDTRFKVLGNERDILVGIGLLDSLDPPYRPAGKGMADKVEILFDPLDDGLGWFQFYFDPDGVRAESGGQLCDLAVAPDVLAVSFLPYPEAHSSACFELGLRRHRWKDEASPTSPIRRWLFAWFRTEEVFRKGGSCGFNVARTRFSIMDCSSWNYAGGNGFQDATSLGRLYRFQAPAHVSAVRARLDGRTLRLEGRLLPEGARLGLELAGPEGERVPVSVEADAGAWRASAEIAPPKPGRYRLYPVAGGQQIEPRYLSVDIPSADRARSFCVSVTYDPPDSIIPNFYTPARLDRDMEIWASLGVRRIHWIEYGDWPSFWRSSNPLWGRHYGRTIRECGDLLRCATQAAHRHGLEMIADFKTFDLGFNSFFVRGAATSSVRDIEGRRVSVIPEIAAHQEWTMQSRADWRRQASLPVERVRLYSEQPMPALRRADVRLLTSRDNRTYRSYGKPFRFRQGTLRRGHMRWTPAGCVPAAGARKNWYVELSGLQVQAGFLAVQLGARRFHLTHRGFMLAEAWDAAGQAVPLTIATGGTPSEGFSFWKEWPTWNNRTEPLLEVRSWDARRIGMAFREMPSMPTLLEPCFEGARGIWLAWIQRMIGSGVDGVDIRSYCHHNGPMCYLKYAFAGPVCERFREFYGRDPEPKAEDYERVRRIRGEAYTQFLREAKALLSRHGRKLIVELESGIEIPPSHDSRMQIFMDWERWLNERIPDEVRLKFWTVESTFVHEKVLPLARRCGIPVHIISRNLATGLDIRAVEMAPLVMGGACAAGLSGYSFYEHAGMMAMNAEGCPTLLGQTRACLEKTAEVLRAMAQ